MNIYNSVKKQKEELERCYANAMQCLSEKRDAQIAFRLPKWMKDQIKESGKSEADFIIAKLGITMFKPLNRDKESWIKEVEEYFN